jgi:hypothetical protein
MSKKSNRLKELIETNTRIARLEQTFCEPSIAEQDREILWLIGKYRDAQRAIEQEILEYQDLEMRYIGLQVKHERRELQFQATVELVHEIAGHLEKAGNPFYARSVRSVVDKISCETCQGHGTVDETLGGEITSNPAAPCPDCNNKSTVLPELTAERPIVDDEFADCQRCPRIEGGVRDGEYGEPVHKREIVQTIVPRRCGTCIHERGCEILAEWPDTTSCGQWSGA